MASCSPLREIIKVAQEIQRDLETLSFPSDGVEVTIEPVVVEEVVSCKPCRVYTHGQEKPEWATHGCTGNGHHNKVVLEPQLPSSERPKGHGWGTKIRQNRGGFSCIHPECQQYNNVFKTKQGAQQHAKKHYPPEYKCQDCNGEWYLKTEYNYHFLRPCPKCQKLYMKTSLAAHAKNCNH